MSAFGKQGSRCDFCGKFSQAQCGQYERKNGRVGDIMPFNGYYFETKEQGYDPLDRDACSDCWDDGVRPDTAKADA